MFTSEEPKQQHAAFDTAANVIFIQANKVVSYNNVSNGKSDIFSKTEVICPL